jgi:RimJ/RimL family protein N-acetyltransferase
MSRSEFVNEVALREVARDDLAAFFEHQLDGEAVRMAAFAAVDPHDRDAFMTRWARIMADGAVVKRTVLYRGANVGHVVRFVRGEEREVTYWIDRGYWGRGIATEALGLFLGDVCERPVFARAAKDNVASVRVLEKCGFVFDRAERGFANARGEEIDEVVLRLGTAASDSGA